MAETRQTAVLPLSATDSGAIKRIQRLTVVWMSVEVAVAVIAAVRADSVALAAFGGDSAIELLSAAVVLWSVSTSRVTARKTATTITGWLLIALALFIVGDSLYALLSTESKPRPSYFGIALLVTSGVAMPWLARRKRQLAAAANSASLRADAAQSSICGYMAWIALAGLLLNAIGHLPWADPVAALGLLPIVIKEAKEALEGTVCCGEC
jgi:divalent metal cation (Fe/Co/Zn/Cd) transporter